MLKTIQRIIKWIGPYKKRLYLGTLCSFLATWCTAVPIITAAWAIDKVIVSTKNEQALSDSFVWLAFLIIVLSVLFRYLLSYARATLQDSIGAERAAEERVRIGEILKRVPLGYFSKNSTGEILADLTSEFSQLELNGMSMINTVLNGYINFLAILLCLSIFSWQAAVVSLIGAMLSAFALRGINRQSQKSSPVNQKASESLAAAVLQYVRGIPVIKAYGQEGPAFSDMQKAFRDSCKINIRIEKSYIPWNAMHLIVLKLASVAIVWITAWNTMQNITPLTFLLLMAMFAFFMFGGVEAINDSAHVLGMIDTAMNKIDRLEQAEFIDVAGKDLTIDSYDICFEHVDFGYTKEKQVIHDISFTAHQGTVTAIVGSSGSGKTTICSLLARFYDVNAGSITVGNRNIRDFTCDSLLRNISMVFQNVYLFRDTIRNNMKFGNPNASEEEIIAAAKAACCHDFIMTLPEGYDTMIGEGGSTLSGGEKQRISIARAILKNAPIVILDEATASIDPENEHLIQQAISKLTRGKTVIVIAHRLATIENADQILVVEHGKIVQKGTHNQLIQQKGIYRSFINIRERAEGWSIA